MVVAALIDALVDRGHEVTLFGAGTRTGTRARFVSTDPRPQHERLGEVIPAVRHTARVNWLLTKGGYDVVHDHTTDGPMTAAARRIPTVATVHGPVDGEMGDYYAALGDSVRLVSISRAQRLRRPGLAWAGTVHNGLPPAAIEEPSATPEGPGGMSGSAASDAARDPDKPVLWLARFTADKGPDLAVRACRAAGVPLVLAGKANEEAEQRYLAETVEPLCDDTVRLVVNGDRDTTRQLLREARCLLMPIRWHEPFGMVLIEAMAVGTPVVALRRGAVPELVRHGVTGWLADEPEELPALLHKVWELDPAACVAHVRRNFTAEVMAQRYERVYLDALRGLGVRRRIVRQRRGDRAVRT